MDNDKLKHNLTSGNQWMRLLYMVLFFFLLELAAFVMLAVVVLQFLFSIISGGANDNLRRLGDQIASYIFQTLQFLIYNTEEKPFPFSEWPESDVEDLSRYESAEEVDGEVVTEDEEVEEAIELSADEAEEEAAEKETAASGKSSGGKKSSTSKKTTEDESDTKE
ncbi:DUF4389 domain-containing protein [Microbulbifer halophilus]|uniref:DUF4389 domain-containing protein n=1 Tax=Microbulbifer halophilus TaxID=453963 RepID=A0ABW5ECY7_9GAMM|nr:DUF4389 domain-containing protein [Microbulbifer halophilus]MCW8127068.1 DUF4389 domain-containing protein [Microbulbifer halophilus]